MAERMPLSEYEDEHAEQSPVETTRSKSAPITDIDAYRKRVNRPTTLRRIGRKALKLPGILDALKVVPVDISDYPNGDITVRYAEYRNEDPQDDFGVPHKGWQGEAQTKRVIAASYDAASDSITTGLVRTRNLRYVESDIRTKRHSAKHEDSLHEAGTQLDAARTELQKEIDDLKAAEARHRGAEAELCAAIARIQAATSELQLARKAVENE